METERAVRAEPGAATVASTMRDVQASLATGRQVESPAREARELLSAILDVPLSWPQLNVAEIVDDAAYDKLIAAAARRAAGAPLAYVVGVAAFRHLTLEVDERVLIPRPETEMLVDLVLERSRGNGTAVDVGTGSGCIALALATESSLDRVIGTDVSLDALAVAARNVERCSPALRANVELRHGSLLDPVRGERVQVVVSNPPYIAADEAIALPPEVRDWEPPLALYSADGGLAITRSLVRQASDVLEGDGLFAMEVDCRRAALVAECLASNGGYEDISVLRDLTGRDRFVVARRARSARDT